MNFAEGELHYHHCPECYLDKPCYMGCTHCPDLDDPPSDPRGRRFGASCDSAVCDDCIREKEDKRDAEYEALARARATTAITLGAQPDFPDRHEVGQKIHDSIMRRRKNYGGGYAWKPDAGWPACVVPYGVDAEFPESLSRITADQAL
jgi:hypothetical protein